MVGSLKPSQFKELFDIPMEEFTNEYVAASGNKVFCASRTMDIYDGKKKIVMTYSNELAYKNKVRTEKALRKALQKIERLKTRSEKMRFTRDELLLRADRIVAKPLSKGS